MSGLVNPTAEDPILTSLQGAICSGEPWTDRFVCAGLGQIEAAQAFLQGPWTEQAAWDLMDDARQRIVRQAEDAALSVLRQCIEGCTVCCHNTGVDVVPLEAIVIALYLKQRCSDDQLDKLRTRLWEVVQRRERFSESERRQVRLRCALLDGNRRCVAYEARPLACAGAFSYSRAACELALRRPEALADCVPLDSEAKIWTMGISGGLQRALADVGLDGNLYELHSAVYQALTTPQALQRWSEGEDLFAGCECTDPHSPPRR